MILANCRIPDFDKKQFFAGSITIRNGTISSVLKKEWPDSAPDRETVLDCAGAYVSPGLCDGHIHIESSLLSPYEFVKEAIHCGTTGIFADPHEIANVLGIKGVEYFIHKAEHLPIDLYVGIPSCVPATHLETSGASMGLDDIKKLLVHKNVYGLAEMMNFPGIIHDTGDARAKVEAVLNAGKIVDGHCPGLSGDDLVTYISNGTNDGRVRISSDHECTSFDEAIEKYHAGMHIMLRLGSASKDLLNILPGFAEKGLFPERLMLVSDDITASDLKERGHVNHLLSISARILKETAHLDDEEAFITALRMCTLNTCSYFNVPAGVVQEGKRANLIIHTSLDTVKPDTILHKGKVVYENGRVIGYPEQNDHKGLTKSLNIPETIDITAQTKNDAPVCRVISILKDSLLTRVLKESLEAKDSIILASPEKDIAKVCVIERHAGTGNIGIGFVKGFGFKHGAIASTVSHDSHNIIALGYKDGLILKAVELLKRSNGGMAAVTENDSAYLPLEIAGLMSSEPIDTVIEKSEALHSFTNKMGFDQEPFSSLSFLALPVIPALKITDLGLVDVEKFEIVELEVS